MWIGLFLFITMFGLIALGVPVAFAMIFSTFVSILVKGDIPLIIIAQRMSAGLNSFPFLALPLFIFAANLMVTGGIAERIFKFALNAIGYIRGGLAHANVLASIIFAGLSGSAQADAAGLGIIEIEMMTKEGYDKDFSAAVTAASSVIGPIIPPSITVIMYSLMAGGVSVARLLLGGIIPGVIMGGCMMLIIVFLAYTGKIKGNIHPKPTLRVFLKALLGAIPVLIAPIVLIAGMLLGLATPTELGAIVTVYSIVLSLVYRSLTLQRVVKALTNTIVTLGVICLIIVCAFPFGWFLTILEIPTMFRDMVLAITTSKWMVITICVGIFLMLGLVMETSAILILLTPILIPLVQAAGIDLVHFGIVEIVALMIGTVTPPFGVCLFITSHLAEEPLSKVVRRILPFYIALGGALILIIYIPEITLFIPNLLLGKP